MRPRAGTTGPVAINAAEGAMGQPSNRQEAAGRMDTRGGFLRMLEIDASEVDRHAGILTDILGGDVQALVVHDVFDGSVLDHVVPRLERHDPPFLKTWFPEAFRSWFFGRNLDLTVPELREYFHEADAFRRHLRELFPQPLEFTADVTRMLSRLAGGRSVGAPAGPIPGQRYMFTTLRAHLEGGFIPPHFDNDKPMRAPYDHLRTLIELPVISYVVAFTMADAGGALEVYNLRHDQVDPGMLDENKTVVPSILGRLESVSFRLRPGSMIVLDSGRYLHRLSPVIGPRKRWTACSFMARSRTQDALYGWG